MPAKSISPNAYEIKITLKDTHPPVWRRVQAPAGLTLYEFHKVIQAVMGWQNYHLHQFIIEGQYYGNPADDEFGDLRILDESNVKLHQVIPRAGYKFAYEYDFGDSWEHEIKVEKVLQLEKRLRRPVCLAGKRACPPEDVGGTYGYEEFLEAIGDPKNEEHESYLEWAGGEFDPQFFSLDQANERLKHRRDEIILDQPAASPLQPAASSPKEALTRWMNQLDSDAISWAENLALRGDMITLLKYLQANKVTGTSARGNFPLKAVREITAQFVHPPQLDETIGNHTYRLRSEEEVWPLYVVHILGVASGMLEGGPSKKWRVTGAGESFLSTPAAVQAWVLFSTWWMAINWLVAFPADTADQYLPEGYKDHCRDLLLSLPVGERVAFEPFVHQLIEAAGLTWPTARPENVQQLMHYYVKDTLIDPLVDFELISPEIQIDEQKYGLQTLVAFEIKAPAKNLLETLGKVG